MAKSLYICLDKPTILPDDVELFELEQQNISSELKEYLSEKVIFIDVNILSILLVVLEDVDCCRVIIIGDPGNSVQDYKQAVGSKLFYASSSFVKEELNHLNQAAIRSLDNEKKQQIREFGTHSAAVSLTSFTSKLLKHVSDIDNFYTLTESIARLCCDFLRADEYTITLFRADKKSLYKSLSEAPYLKYLESAEESCTMFYAVAAQSAVVTDISQQLRYTESVDAPSNLHNKQLLVSNIKDIFGNVIVQFKFYRDENAAIFTDQDRGAMDQLCSQLLPLVHEPYGKCINDYEHFSATGKLFRAQAIDYHLRGNDFSSGVLKLNTKWIAVTLPLMVFVLLSCFVFASIFEIGQYATGSAYIVETGKSEVVSPISGVVEAVHVLPGQRVNKGDSLVSFYSSEQQAVYQRSYDEYQSLLRRRMLDLSDQSIVSQLASARQQLELSKHRLASLSIRADREGVVTDLRVQPNKNIAQGQTLLAMKQPQTAYQMVALIPGKYRPAIQSGQKIRLELNGFPYSYQYLEIDQVADEIISTENVKRLLPASIANSLEQYSGVVLVTANIPSEKFESQGKEYAFFDGLPAIAEVQTNKESILLSMFPSFKKMLD